MNQVRKTLAIGLSILFVLIVSVLSTSTLLTQNAQSDQSTSSKKETDATKSNNRELRSVGFDFLTQVPHRVISKRYRILSLDQKGKEVFKTAVFDWSIVDKPVRVNAFNAEWNSSLLVPKEGTFTLVLVNEEGKEEARKTFGEEITWTWLYALEVTQDCPKGTHIFGGDTNRPKYYF